MLGRMTVASGFCMNCVFARQLLLRPTSMQSWRETAMLPMLIFYFHLHLMVVLLSIFMKYVLTDHAQKRIAKRQIRTQWIEDTLSYPARIESDQEDSELLHVLRPIAERGFRVLREIYNETANPVFIVTAYFDDEVNNL
jgi:hypothetical protein